MFSPHGQPGIQGEVLEDDRDAGVDAAQRLPVGEDFAAGGREQADQRAQQRALAAAAGAKQRDDFVGVDGERHVSKPDGRRIRRSRSSFQIGESMGAFAIAICDAIWVNRNFHSPMK